MLIADLLLNVTWSIPIYQEIGTFLLVLLHTTRKIVLVNGWNFNTFGLPLYKLKFHSGGHHIQGPLGQVMFDCWGLLPWISGKVCVDVLALTISSQNDILFFIHII